MPVVNSVAPMYQDDLFPSTPLLNPFLALTNTESEIDANTRPQNLLSGILHPLRNRRLERVYDLPAREATYFDYYDFALDPLREAQRTGDISEALEHIPFVLNFSMTWLATVYNLELSHASNEILYLGGDKEWMTRSCFTSGTVDGFPIYLYTDPLYRHAARQGIARRDMDLGNFEWPDDASDTVDVLDLAALISMAQCTMNYKVPRDKINNTYTVNLSHNYINMCVDGNSKVHTLYPSSDCKRMIAVTSEIPHDTAFAIHEGHPELSSQKIKVFRDTFDIKIDNDEWGSNEFFQVLGGFFKQGVELAKITPYLSN
ncbi:hypothetical protein H0H81_001672 [Sphagnurus paluster]|uniref:Uncharacterized protein n=1 Tax=Sphagnurus paluster TaxID=117069 RepID=A0A9P7GIF3_9AGAR|nr:hypothetical protein H0H81_001672 [Sphagnurus paluster]